MLLYAAEVEELGGGIGNGWKGSREGTRAVLILYT